MLERQGKIKFQCVYLVFCLAFIAQRFGHPICYRHVLALRGGIAVEDVIVQADSLL